MSLLLDQTNIVAFVLILIRVSVFVSIWPLFGQLGVPMPIKILFALLLTFIVLPIVHTTPLLEFKSSWYLVYLAFKESLCGILLGFLTRFFFYVVSMCGQLVGISMGLGSAQLLNPTIGVEGSSLEQFQVILASLIFLSINGHHLFLSGLIQSFDLIPIQLKGFNFLAFKSVVVSLEEILIASFKMAAPVIISVLLMNISIGIIGRAVPQINVLVTSWPINIFLGLIILIISMPLYLDEIQHVFYNMVNLLYGVIKTI